MTPAGDDHAVSAAAPVFDVDAASFQQAVLDASCDTPILVDFWAAWCGPCMALGPLLERLALDSAGAFRLAKVDTDAQGELAAAHGIRSLPTVRLFVDGTPVAQFMGAQPESAVRAFLQQHLPAAAVDDAAIEAIAALLHENRADEALAALAALPEAARATPVPRCLALRAQLLREVQSAPALELLQARVEDAPGDLEAHYLLAMRHASAGRFAAALEHLLLVLSRDRALREDGARRAMLQVFDALGASDPLVVRYRTLLASALH